MTDRAARQAALVAAHRAGDRSALPALAADVANLVRWVAGKYSRRGLEREDIEGEAWVGFMDAVNSFDESKGTFASHAATWMRCRASKAVTAGFGTPATRRAFWRLSSAERDIAAAGGEATDAAVAELLDVKERDVARVRARDVQLDERLQSPHSDLDGMLDDAAAMRRLRAAVEGLPPRLRAVVEGVVDGRDVATEMGVSRQRIGQLKAEAIKRLREEMRG